MGEKAGYRSELKKAKIDGRSATPKQIRARARRNGGMENLSEKEKAAMLKKPMEEWDLEELAKGRPKDKNGNFTGRAPTWVTREMHEKSIELFKEMIRTDMRSHTVVAMTTLKNMLEDEETDERGKPHVPAGTKADIAKFLIEHLIGKPTQPIQADINLKLQGILGAVLVQPEAMDAFVPSSSHRDVIDGVVEDDEEGGGE